MIQEEYRGARQWSRNSQAVAIVVWISFLSAAIGTMLFDGTSWGVNVAVFAALLARPALALPVMAVSSFAGLAAAAGGPLVAIAPSDAGGGTNALLLCPPEAITPAFGAGSFEAHLRAAEAAAAAP